jgi:hypothetical protein
MLLLVTQVPLTESICHAATWGLSTAVGDSNASLTNVFFIYLTGQILLGVKYIMIITYVRYCHFMTNIC